MWEELYEDHYKELVAYGTRMSGSKELAEDLVQEGGLIRLKVLICKCIGC